MLCVTCKRRGVLNNEVKAVWGGEGEGWGEYEGGEGGNEGGKGWGR